MGRSLDNFSPVLQCNTLISLLFSLQQQLYKFSPRRASPPFYQLGYLRSQCKLSTSITRDTPQRLLGLWLS